MPQQIEIHHRLLRDDSDDHRRVAVEVSRCVDVVSVQHGPGIWGGEGGSYVLEFVRALAVPAVATLHAVPRQPSEAERAVIAALAAEAQATVVMSRAAADRLTADYGVDPDRVAVIDHGVLDLPLVEPETMKPALELEGRDVILSFGLMAPGKGYEDMIEALPAVVASHPTACYVIVGATLAEQVASHSEAYRRSLMERVGALGLTGHVRFVDRFVGRVELTRWLEAADVFVTPYRDHDKDSSGTLAYAMGAGRAVGATPYACAVELLGDGRGVVAASGRPADLATAIEGLLADPDRRAEIGRRAYEHTRSMTWPQVGAAYRELYTRVARDAHVAAGSPAPVRPMGETRRGPATASERR